MESILVVGNGNVAFHLRKALQKAGYHLVLDAKDENFDVVIFSISDDAYAGAVAEFPYSGKLMVHTSGSVPSSVFSSKTDTYGVVYPFQTIKKTDVTLDFKQVPLMVTASDSYTEKRLFDLARKLSERVTGITDEQRLKLHLSGVFANNFTNHMIAIAQQILLENNMDKDVLNPLLEKTFLQIKQQPASRMQTGPAVRNDIKIMEKHLKLLENHPEWQKVYSFVSDSIQKNDNKKT